MQSIRKKSFAAEQLAKRQQKKSPATIAVIVLAVVIAVGAVGYALYVRFGVKEAPTEAVAPEQGKIKSIAVLPFVNRSVDPEQEYFCDGIADAILNALTHVGDLRVIARSSSFAFRGDAVDISEVGRKLNVEWVLEGSVQKAGNDLLITAQLIKVADLSHLFSDTYKRELKDVFAIQEEIARTVVDELKVKLLKKEKEALVKRPTDNIEAYRQYRLGQHTLDKVITPEDMEKAGEKAREYFHRAIDLDPDFAEAYVGLAWTYGHLIYVGYTDKTREKSKELIEKALEFDDTLPEAYVTLGAIYMFDWDFPVAERNYKKALSLNPGLAGAHTSYAKYLRIMG